MLLLETVEDDKRASLRLALLERKGRLPLGAAQRGSMLRPSTRLAPGILRSFLGLAHPSQGEQAE